MSYFSLIPFPCCPSCSQRQVYTKSPVCLKALWTLIKAFSSSCCLNYSLNDWFSFKQSSSSTVSLSLTLIWSEILDILKEKESTVHSSQFSDWRFDNLSGSHHQSQVHLTLVLTSAQVVETSVTITDNSPSRDYTHPDDQTTLLHVTPGFKPFTVLVYILYPVYMLYPVCALQSTVCILY